MHKFISLRFNNSVGNPFNIRTPYDDDDPSTVNAFNRVFKPDETMKAKGIPGQTQRIIYDAREDTGVFSRDWKEVVLSTKMAMTCQNGEVFLAVNYTPFSRRHSYTETINIRERTLKLMLSILVSLDADPKLDGKIKAAEAVEDPSQYPLTALNKEYLFPLASVIPASNMFVLLELMAVIARPLYLGFETDPIYQVCNVDDVKIDDAEKVIRGVKALVKLLYKESCE